MVGVTFRVISHPPASTALSRKRLGAERAHVRCNLDDQDSKTPITLVFKATPPEAGTDTHPARENACEVALVCESVTPLDRELVDY
jgi:hypothetical protein